jgi:hypothetical protein
LRMIQQQQQPQQQQQQQQQQHHTEQLYRYHVICVERKWTSTTTM